ncbi:hypothetical protein D3C80_1804570 [compost metagenome]
MDSVRARLEFVTCALIQLSITAKRQATAMPMTKRINIQNRGWMMSGMAIDAAEATAAMVAKARIWPIRRRSRVTEMQPSANPML